MLRASYLVIAAICYAAFLVSFLYFVGFIAGLPQLPTSVNAGLSAAPERAAIIDVGLIALFGIQHSVMARQGFKQWLTRVVPWGLERSVYCLASAMVLGVMFRFWHPINAIVWDVTSPLGSTILWGLFFLGIAIVFVSTWLINHFELFGLSQAWHAMRGVENPSAEFRTPLFYRLVRHPIYTGFAIALWSTPHMTVGHMILSVGMTLYLLIGIHYEERDLIRRFGGRYEEYRVRVAMIVPMPRGR